MCQLALIGGNYMRKRFGCNPISEIIFDIMFYLFLFLIPIGTEKLTSRFYKSEEWEYELWDKFKLILYIFFVVLVVCEIFKCVLKTHCDYLILTENEIVYHTGFLNKKTVNIPLNKIRTYSKSSGLFQRAFGVSNISVTTAGDQPEIKFCDLKGGDEAYDLIAKMLK